jgi:tRNA dimethylallyltransferase
MHSPQHIAIIGPTASGKTALALEWAAAHRGVILSLDSLSLYRHIDIASAKPTQAQRLMAPHFGIDILDPDEPFDVTMYAQPYREAYAEASRRHGPLMIVGGSSFYLKILLEGISPLPTITHAIRKEVADSMRTLSEAYSHLRSIDPLYARSIDPHDRYRIEKGLLIAQASGQTPTDYFRQHPPRPIIEEPVSVYEIQIERTLLRERISLRTAKMLREGLIDEVCGLERRYTRAPHPMKAIGIIEVLAYLDGRYTYDAMREAIITHTAQLAKRQVTFNKTKLDVTFRGSAQEIREKAEEDAGKAFLQKTN